MSNVSVRLDRPRLLFRQQPTRLDFRYVRGIAAQAGSDRRRRSGRAYLDRAAPCLALAKFVGLAFTAAPFIERAAGSNWPRRISWPGRSALASRFLAFCAAFAFARWRALALVMASSPF